VRGSRLDCGGGVRRFFPGIWGQPSGPAWMPRESHREAGPSQAKAGFRFEPCAQVCDRSRTRSSRSSSKLMSSDTSKKE
jgi:hypothetical protein